DLVHDSAPCAPREPRGSQTSLRLDGREALVPQHDRHIEGRPQLVGLRDHGTGRRALRSVERERQADDHHLRLGLGHERRDASVVLPPVAGALHDPVRRRERPRAVRERDPDAPTSDVEPEGAHRPPAQAIPAAARTWSSAASSCDGSRPPATASSGFLPPPPLTVRAASAISSAAWRPLSFVTADTSAAPPPSGSPPTTTARMPGCWRTATA